MKARAPLVARMSAAPVLDAPVLAARVGAALLLAALLLPCGCTIVHRTSGRVLPEARAQLVVGQTTKAQALVALGPPASIRRQFDGDLLLWRRDELHSETLLLVPLVPIYERTTGHTDADVLALLFDHAGLLAGIGEQRDIH